MKKIVLSLILVLFLISFVNASSKQIPPSNTSEYMSEINSDQAVQRSFAIQSTNITITDDDAVLGNPNAPVTMVEFGAYWEFFSYQFWNETYPQIKSNYIDTGKLKASQEIR